MVMRCPKEAATMLTNPTPAPISKKFFSAAAGISARKPANTQDAGQILAHNGKSWRTSLESINPVKILGQQHFKFAAIYDQLGCVGLVFFVE